MIKKAAQHVWSSFRSLSRHHYRTLVITVLLPAVAPAIAAYVTLDSLALQIFFSAAAYLVWSVFAVLAVSNILAKDREEAKQLAARQVGEIPSQVSKLAEQYDDLKAELRQQLKDLEENVRTTFASELRIDFPHRRIAVRAGSADWNFTAMVGKAELSQRGGSKGTRLRRRFIHIVRWLWKTVYG